MLFVSQLVKKFSAPDKTRKFITPCTTAHHWPLSWDKRIHSRHSHSISPKTLLQFNVTALFTPKSPKRPLRLKFSSWNFVFIYQFLHACYTSHPNHFPCSDHPNNIYWRVQTQEAHLCAILSVPLLLVLSQERPQSENRSSRLVQNNRQDSLTRLKLQRTTWVKLDWKSV